MKNQFSPLSTALSSAFLAPRGRLLSLFTLLLVAGVSFGFGYDPPTKSTNNSAYLNSSDLESFSSLPSPILICPTGLAPQVTVTLDASGLATVDATTLDPSFTGTATLTPVPSTPTKLTYGCDDLGSVNADYDITYGSGSSGPSMCGFILAIVDTQNPIITCPADADISADLNCEASLPDYTGVSAGYVVTDNCSTTITQSPAAGTTLSTVNAATTVTLTATDGAGNTGTCTFEVTLIDDTPPTALCQDFTLMLDGSGNGTVLVTDIDDGSSDNCTSINASNLSLDVSSFDCSNVGANSVVLTVTDDAGLTSTCPATVTVVDNVPPVAVCQDVTVQLDASGMASVLTGSSFSLGAVAGILQTQNNGSAVLNTSCDCPPGYVAVGYDGTVGAIVDEFRLQCRELNLDGTLGGLTTTCFSGSNTAASASSSGSLDHALVGFTVQDGDFTFQTPSSARTHISFTGYELSIADISASVGSNTGAALSSFGGTGQFSSNPSTSTLYVPDGHVIVGMDVEQGPTFSSALAFRYAPIIQLATIADGSSDNCGSFTYTVSQPTFTCSELGPNTVTLTVTDGAGNTDDCTATVTVEDNIPPVASCMAYTAMLDATGNVTITPANVDGGSTDNCGIVTYALSQTAFTCSDIGPQTVTLTVTDASGNSDDCTAIVTVSDDTSPVITQAIGSLDQTVPNDPGQCGAVVTLTDPTATDNCLQSISASSSLTTIFSANNSASNFIGGNMFDVENLTSGPMSFDSYEVSVLGSGPLTIEVYVTTTATSYLGNQSNASAWTLVGSASATPSSTINTPVPVAISGLVLAPSESRGLYVTVSSGSARIQYTNGSNTYSNADLSIETGLAAQYAFGGTPNLFFSPRTWNGTINYTTTSTSGGLSVGNNAPAGNNFPVGMTPLVYTVTDAAGNSSQFTANITVNDVEPPVANCVAPFSIDLDASGNASIDATDIDDNSTDNCGISSRVIDISTFTCADVGPNTVMLTVTDGAGNSSSCSTTVTVNDITIPDAVCQDISINLDASGNATITAAQIDGGSMDACGIASISASPTSFNCSDLGPNNVTLTVTDDNGLTNTCVAVVTVVDVTPPTLTFCPDVPPGQTYAFELTSDIGVCERDYKFTPPRATDECAPGFFQFANLVSATTDNGTIIEQGIITTSGIVDEASFPVGVTTVFYTFADPSGNTTVCEFTVQVVDQQAPGFAQIPSPTANNDLGLCSAVVNFNPPIATDNCPGVAGFQTDATGLSSGSVFPVGTTTLEYTATDAGGLMTTITFDVVVTDTEAPVVSTPAGDLDQTMVSNDVGMCSAVVMLTDPTATDNCDDANITITNDAPVGNVFPVGTTVVTYTVSDNATPTANTTTYTATITVLDLEAPVVSTTAGDLDQTMVANDAGLCSAVVTLTDPMATDNCDNLNITISNDAPAGNVFPVGTTTVTYTVSDNATPTANTTTFTADITVLDTEDPMILQMLGSLDQSVSTDPGVCGATVTLGTLSASDNCGIASTTNDAPALFPVGTTLVTWTVTDDAGNTATFTADITVADGEAPMVTQTAGSLNQPNVSTDQGVCGATVTLVDPSATDNCGVTSISNDAPALFPVGTTTVTWTLADDAGNSAQFMADITVTDNEAPTAVCQNITVQLDASGSASITAAPPVAGPLNGTTGNLNASDPVFARPNARGGAGTFCSTTTDANHFYDTHSFSIATAGMYTFTVTSGSTDTYMLLYEGGFSPASACDNLIAGDDDGGSGLLSEIMIQLNMVPGNYTLVLTTFGGGQTGAYTLGTTIESGIDGGSTDNCGIVSYLIDQTTFDCSNIGANTVTLTVEDAEGNTDQCQATVTVEDLISPTAVCQDITVQLDANGIATVQASQVDNGSSDNCGTVTLAVSPSTFTCSETGANTVTLTVTDGSNNVSTCTATVTVEDVELPVLTCDGDQTVEADASCGGALPDYTLLTGLVSATDNCSAVLTQVPAAGTLLSLGVAQSVTITATDPSGNSDDCTFNVTLIDVTAPTFTYCPPGFNNLTNDPGDCDRDFFFDRPEAMDNCNGFGSPASSVTYMAMTDNGTNITLNANPTQDFGSFPVGTTNVTYTATDGSGNSETCVFTVVVIDNSLPTLGGLPTMITVGNDVGNCSAVVALPSVFPADNCGVASVTNDAPAGNLYPVGTTVLTFTVTDVNGNAATFSTDVVVNDTELPVVTQALTSLDQTVGSDAGLCGAAVMLVDPTATDNCGVTSIANDAPATFPVGTTMVTYTISDMAGNTANFTAQITVNDIEAPMITQTATSLDQSVPTDPGACTATVTLGTPTATDNCAVTSITNDAPAVFSVGTTTVTWTVSDDAGNTATFTADIIVNEIEAPVITQTAGSLDQSVLTAQGVCGATVALGTPTATDNCGIASTTNDAPALFPVGTTLVTWTVTDDAGNTATFTATITVADGEAPMVTQTAGSLDQPSVTTDQGVCGATVTLVDPSATDNCGVTSVSNDAPSLFPVGTTIVTWTVSDMAGNSATFTADITVTDGEAPTPICQDVTIQLDASGNATLSVAQVDNGSNDACGIASLVLDRTTFTCTDAGSNTVTMTVTDNNGNTSSCTSFVTVEDLIDPTPVCQDLTVQLDANGLVSITAAMIDNGSSDNCGIATYSLDETDFDCSHLGANPVILTVTDGAGNMSTCTATVTVEDIELPVLTCDGDQTIDADASCAGVLPDYTTMPGIIFATDNCSAVLTQVPAPGTALTLGVAQSVTITATDPSSNAVSCTFNATLIDVTPPMITCVGNFAGLSNDPGDCDRDFFFDPPTVIDNCVGISPSPVTITVSTDNGTNITQGVVFQGNTGDFGSFPVGITTVTYTATDAALNSASCSFTVEVIDNSLPTLGGLPTMITVGNDVGNCGAVVAAPSVFPVDNCGIASVTHDAPAGNLYPVGTTVLTFTVTDVNGNAATFSTDVVVNDTELPVVTQALTSLDQTVGSDAGLCGAAVMLVDPTATDNCGVTSITNDAPTTFPVGTTMVTYTISDMAGNTANFTSQISVNDIEAPMITQTATSLDQSVPTDPGACTATVTLVDPMATDNCGVTSITNDAPAVFSVGTTTVTWTVSDAAGNTATFAADITVTENEAPVITQTAGSLDQSVLTAQGVCGATVALGTPMATDNCGIASTTNDAPMLFPVGTTLVTWTVTDDAGNTATFTATITVADGEAPMVTQTAGSLDQPSVTTDQGVCGATVTLVDPSATDNCGVTSVSNDAPSLFPVGTTVVTWTVSDMAGNTATFTADITVTDGEAPMITQTAGSLDQPNVMTDQGVCGATVTLVDPSATDNCGVTSVSNDAPSLFPVGTTMVTWTVSDMAGNTATFTADITVTDGEAPMITQTVGSLDQSLGTDPTAPCGATVTLVDPSAMDNCGIASITNDAPSLFPVGATTVTWTATDDAGNTAMFTANITVTDDDAPTVLCQAYTVQLDASGVGSLTPADIDGGTFDNCSSGVDLALVASQTAFTCSDIGTVMVELTATDAAGNSASCMATVTVEDNVAPTFTVSCPGNQVFDNNPSSCIRLYTFPRPMASDGCNTSSSSPTTVTVAADNGVSILQVGANDFANFPVGVTTVTYTADDGNGNLTSCSFTVTVNDVTPPTLTNVPGDISVGSELGVCGASVTWADVTASDNCSGVVMSSTHNSGDNFPVGVTTVTYTAVDGAGLITSMSFDVTVTDVEAPMITCPADITVILTPGQTQASVSIPVPVTSDNCNVASVDNDQFAGPDASGLYPVGVTTVTYTVADDAGLSATCTFTVEVLAPNTNTLLVSPKVFLQGALVSLTQMRTDISDGTYGGMIPAIDPITGQSATGAVGPGSGVVDYVQVELRDNVFGAPLLATQSGLLKSDGQVVGLDGVSPVEFQGYADGSYFIAINHRNHLGVMTALAVSNINSTTTTVVDFTNPAAPGGVLTNGIDDRAILGSVFALHAGDANGDGVITFLNATVGGLPRGSDYAHINFTVIFGASPSSLSSQVPGYRMSDVNLTGSSNFLFAPVGFTDAQSLFNWITANGNSQFTIRAEQLP